MSIDTDELIFIAKKAALDAGQLLAKNRSNLNKNLHKALIEFPWAEINMLFFLTN